MEPASDCGSTVGTVESTGNLDSRLVVFPLQPRLLLIDYLTFAVEINRLRQHQLLAVHRTNTKHHIRPRSPISNKAQYDDSQTNIFLSLKDPAFSDDSHECVLLLKDPPHTHRGYQELGLFHQNGSN